MLGSTNQTSPILKGISALSRLKRLYLARISRPIAIPSGIDSLTNLVELKLQNVSLFGEFPEELCHLPRLRYLSLASNPKLTGSIPANITRLSRLEVLWLHGSGLEGHSLLESRYR